MNYSTARRVFVIEGKLPSGRWYAIEAGLHEKAANETCVEYRELALTQKGYYTEFHVIQYTPRGR